MHKERKRVYSIRIKISLIDILKQTAKIEKVTISDLVERAIIAELEKISR